MSTYKLLIIDDEPNIRSSIQDFLEAKGFRTEGAESCQTGLAAFQSTRPDLVVTDFRMADGNAIDLLVRMKEIDATIPVIILTAYGTIDLAVHAIKLGAEHFLTKPLELPLLHMVIERALENDRNRRKRMVYQSHTGREEIDPFSGTSAAIRELSETARRVVQTDSPILILGETGTGKSVLARWLHDHGPRGEEAFVDLNCASLTREFLESELFGHEKGAFTGAVTTKVGLLEVAHRGTLFLDEIGDVDVGVQPKLLKVIEQKQFRRLGDVRDRVVDVRMIAATNQQLSKLVEEKKFRSDLYFRISAIPLRMPSLRERAGDIPQLAAQFLAKFAAHRGRVELTLSPEAMEALQTYSWPGNIRELRNVIERAVLLRKRDVLLPEDLRFEESRRPSERVEGPSLTLAELERQHIERVLREESGNVAEAAKRLGIPRSSLYAKVKRLNLV